MKRWVAPLLALLLVGIEAVGCGSSSGRSQAALCQVYWQGAAQIRGQEQAQQNPADPFAALGNVASDLSAVEDLFQRMDTVAPSDIEPDIAQLRDGLKQAVDSSTSGSLSGLAGALFSNLSLAGPSQRVSTYLNACSQAAGAAAAGGTETTSTSEATTPTVPAPTLADLHETFSTSSGWHYQVHIQLQPPSFQDLQEPQFDPGQIQIDASYPGSATYSGSGSGQAPALEGFVLEAYDVGPNCQQYGTISGQGVCLLDSTFLGGSVASTTSDGSTTTIPGPFTANGALAIGPQIAQFKSLASAAPDFWVLYVQTNAGSVAGDDFPGGCNTSVGSLTQSVLDVFTGSGQSVPLSQWSKTVQPDAFSSPELDCTFDNSSLPPQWPDLPSGG